MPVATNLKLWLLGFERKQFFFPGVATGKKLYLRFFRRQGQGKV